MSAKNSKPNKKTVTKMLLRDNCVIFSEKDEFTLPVKGSSAKFSLGVFPQKLFKNGNVLTVAKNIQQEIAAKKFDVISGHGYEAIPVAYETAKRSKKQFLPIEKSYGYVAGFREESPLAGKKVVLVSGVLGTGQNTMEAVRLIARAGGKVVLIVAIFDYQFHLCKELLASKIPIVALSSTKTVLNEKEGNDEAYATLTLKYPNRFRPEEKPEQKEEPSSLSQTSAEN